MTDAMNARGTLGIGAEGDFRIRFDRLLPYPPERVWLWLTVPEKLDRWLPGCRIDAVVGGHVTFDFGEEGAATGEVRQLEEARRLEHTWVWEGVPTSQVAWTLEPVEAGTHLSLVHREVLPEPAVDFAAGWHLMLEALELDLAGEPTDKAWERAEEISAMYAR